MKGASFLNDALTDPVSSSSMSPANAPFRYAHGMHIFDYYAQVCVFIIVDNLRSLDCHI